MLPLRVSPWQSLGAPILTGAILHAGLSGAVALLSPASSFAAQVVFYGGALAAVLAAFFVLGLVGGLDAQGLAEIDRAKTAFFSNVSHEFRTPLTLMLGPIEQAISSPARALTGSDLETTHRNAVRLLKLVNTLLDFARIESGRAQPAFCAVDLAALTRDYASAFRAAVERAGLRFTVDCHTPGEPIYVDASMWEKVVLNLLSNAVKFTPDGGRVSVFAKKDTTHVEIAVQDTGIGIAPEDQAAVFEEFKQVGRDYTRKAEGTGLGLALTKRFVELHGGTVHALSDGEGKGATFVVRLPRAAAAAPAAK